VIRSAILGVLLALLLAGCAGRKPPIGADRGGADVGPGGVKIGKPYQVGGVWYYPQAQPAYDETGIASWYGADFHGRQTANGERYDMNALTAAHKTLPMPSRVRVTNLENGRSIVLRINDRGPFAHGRVIDVSRRGAQLLGFDRVGTARVRVTLVDDADGGETAVASREEMPALPQGAVASEGLALPDGARQARPRQSQTSAAKPRPSAAREAQPPASEPRPVARAGVAPGTVARLPVEQAEGAVQVLPVRPTRLFVQAGAFHLYNNANRLRAQLAGYGPTRITSIVVDRQEFFRVRVGPLASVEAADQILNRVIAGGFTEARIVVD
jgi:rare lipoprotein A